MAEETKQATTGGQIGTQSQPEGAEQEAQTFDDVLKNKDFQSEFDRRVAKALKTAEMKWAEELEGKLAEQLSEAQKLAKMTAEQKAEHERQKAEADLQKRIAEVTRRELAAEAKDTLVSKGLPVELAETLNYEDAERCTASMEAVEKAFQAAVEKRVNEKLRGTPPPAAEGSVTVTKEQFGKMSYAERLSLYNEDKQTYDKLMEGEG